MSHMSLLKRVFLALVCLFVAVPVAKASDSQHKDLITATEYDLLISIPGDAVSLEKFSSVQLSRTVSGQNDPTTEVIDTYYSSSDSEKYGRIPTIMHTTLKRGDSLQMDLSGSGDIESVEVISVPRVPENADKESSYDFTHLFEPRGNEHFTLGSTRQVYIVFDILLSGSLEASIDVVPGENGEKGVITTEWIVDTDCTGSEAINMQGQPTDIDWPYKNELFAKGTSDPWGKCLIARVTSLVDMIQTLEIKWDLFPSLTNPTTSMLKSEDYGWIRNGTQYVLKEEAVLLDFHNNYGEVTFEVDKFELHNPASSLRFAISSCAEELWQRSFGEFFTIGEDEEYSISVGETFAVTTDENHPCITLLLTTGQVDPTNEWGFYYYLGDRPVDAYREWGAYVTIAAVILGFVIVIGGLFLREKRKQGGHRSEEHQQLVSKDGNDHSSPNSDESQPNGLIASSSG